MNPILAQDLSGKVVYKVDMDSFINKMDSEGNQNPSDGIFKNVAKHIKNFSAELVFEDNFSSFGTAKSLVLGENDKNLDDYVKKLISEGTYYSNFNDSIQIFITEFDNKPYKVKSNFEHKEWKILNETKRIGKFQCYKATHTVIVNGKETTITAWYTPEIPKALGPKTYVGQLPGLILQLEEGLLTYYCSEIKLNSKETINWPNKDETISKESFDKIVEAAFESFFGSKKQN